MPRRLSGGTGPATAEPRFKPPKRDPAPRAWNSTLPARSFKAKARPVAARPGGSTKLGIGAGKSKSGPRNLGSGVTSEMRREVFRRAGGFCQAAGLHDPNCPGRLEMGWGWNAHHVQPRSKGGADELENLLAVWTGGPAAAGCHGRIHGRPAEAKRLGLLRGRAAVA